MGVITCPCKCVLGIVNGVILLAGLLLAAAGGVLLALSSNPTLTGTLQDLIKKVIDSLNIIKGTETDNPTSQFVELLQPAGIVLLVVGLFILAVSILGYCGLACYIVVLKVYVVVLIVILAIEVIAAGLIFSGKFNDQVQTQLVKIITDQYGGIDDMSLYSVIPNILMIQYKCCGVHDHGDFNNTKKWNRTREFEFNGQTRVVDLTTPIACCVTTGTFPNVKLVDDYCAVNPNNATSNFERGCWSKVSDELSGYRTGIILVTVAVMLAQLAFIIIVIVIICAD